MKEQLKRILAMTLAMCMLFGICPASALAEAVEGEEPVEVHEHRYAAVVTEASCTAGGYTTYTCQDESCGDSYVTDEVPALGHSWGEWAEAEGVRSRSCSVCGETETETVIPEEEEAAQLSGDYKPLYFYNEEGWEAVYAAWSFDEEDFADSVLPGVAMTETALAGVWAVNVPVEADAIVFSNGAVGEGQRKVETAIPAEGDLYARGVWQYSYAFVAPLAAGSFNVSAVGNGTVSIDGNVVSGLVSLEEGSHSITVAPAFGEGYYVKSLSIGGEAVNLDAQTFSNGACTVNYNLGANESAAVAVVFALYRPAMTGTIYVSDWSRDTRYDGLESKVIEAVFGENAAVSGYTVKMLARNSLFDQNQSYQTLTELKIKETMSSGISVAIDVGQSEYFSISFEGNNRYPGFSTIEGIKLSVKEARPAPAADCSLSKSGDNYYVEMDAKPSDWETWAKSVITVAAGGTDLTGSAKYTVTPPSSFPTDGQTPTCTVKVSIEATENYTALKETTFTITIKNPQYPAKITVINPSDGKGLTAEIKVYTDAACTTELKDLSSVADGTYYVKAIAQPGCELESLNVAGQTFDSGLESGKALTVTFGSTEAKQYAISASAKRLTYTVQFVNYDGTTLKTVSGLYYGDTPVYDGAEPTKAADAQYSYTFAGWDKEIATVTGNAVYTATFSETVNKYTVTFKNLDGTVLQRSEVAYGETPVYTGKTPAKAATAKYTYTFAGWDKEIAEVTGNAEYTATFSETVNKYTVTFKNYDGTVLQRSKVAYDETPVYTGETPTRAADAQYSYTFAGWDKQITKVTGNVEYTATFSSSTEYYTVTFKNYDGTVLESKKWVYGATPNYNGTPTKAADAQYSYTFAGWDKEIAMVTGNAEYTAVFTETVNKYNVTFKNLDGTVLQSAKVAYGETPVYTGETPAKAGNAQYSYSFAGWDKEIAEVTGNAVYTATFSETVNKYTVTFIDGSDESTAEVEYGDTVSAPVLSDTDDDNRVLLGWYDSSDKLFDFATAITGELKLRAKWAEDINNNGIDDSVDTRYTVTYDYNGNGWESYSKSVLVGLDTPAVSDPTWDNHVFKGWSPAVSDTVETNVTYTAQWADDNNENGVDDSTETAVINLTVTGKGSAELSESFPRTFITDNGDGTYTVLFDSETEGANVIDITATPADTDGSDGYADYVDSMSHEQLALENGQTYEVTVAFAGREIPAVDGEIAINRFKAANGLTNKATALEVTGAIRGDILEAAGLDASEPYTVSTSITVQGHELVISFTDSGAVLEGDTSALPADMDVDQIVAYAIKDIESAQVVIALAADGKLPAVEKSIEITVKEARSAADISLRKTVIEMDFDKAAEVEAAAKANVSASYGADNSPISAQAIVLDADKEAEELMTGEVQTITYKVSVAETANYTGAEAEFTVKAKHKTYEPVITLTKESNDGVAGYIIVNGTVTVTAAPNEGCYVESVLCTLNGERVEVTGSYADDHSYIGSFKTELGDDRAKEYKVTVSYGKRSIAKNSSIADLTYNEDEETLLKGVYNAIVDKDKSVGGIEYGKVSVTANKEITGAGVYEFTVTWADDSVKNKYPTLSVTAEVRLTNELILAPDLEQSMTAKVENGVIVITEEDILNAVDEGNVPENAKADKSIYYVTVDMIKRDLAGQGDCVVVPIDITAGGEGTPYDPARVRVYLTIYAPVNQAKVTVADYENGSVRINGTEADPGSASYAPGIYEIELKGSGDYVPNTLVITLDGEELVNADGTDCLLNSLDVIDGTGKALDYVPEYVIKADFAVASVEIPEEATMNYYVGMEGSAEQLEELAMEALEGSGEGIVFTPADLEEGSTQLSYRAREAKTYTYTATIDPRDYGLGFIPAQTVEVPIEAEELWLNLDEDFTPPEGPGQEQIKAIVDRVIETYGIDALMDMYENDRDRLVAILKAEVMSDPAFVNYYTYFGAHRFGDDVTNTELVKLSVESGKYGTLESKVCRLTLDDTRIETEISANTGVELVYGFSTEDLVAALGAKVMGKDGADLGAPVIETDVEAMGASDKLQTVKLVYPGSDDYRRCSAEVKILVKRAKVDVFVDNRLIKWSEGLSYQLPVATDPAGIDTIAFIAGLNVAGANIDSGAIGSGNPVAGLRGDIILFVPEAVRGTLAHVGIVEDSYMTLAELRDALLSLADMAGVSDSTNESVSKLLGMLEGISDDKLNNRVYIGSKLPTDIGVYVVGAVSADANYETDFGAGYIIIAPNGIKAELAWNMNDDNYAITLDKLEGFDFGAGATVIDSTVEGAELPGDVNAQLEYLFVGVDAQGELLIDRCTDPNSVELSIGAYSQIAYIANWGNVMYYAEPIARPVIVTPNVADVAILDSKGNENYAQLVTYDGSEKAVTVTVDGKTVTEGLTVKYIGSDLTGDGWYRDTAPTDAGAYTVVAIYTEKDANGNLVKAGAAVAAMVIEPADAEVSLNDAEYIYDGSEYFAEIVNTEFDYITVAVDKANNTAYINLPDDTSAHVQGMIEKLPAAAQSKLEAFLSKYENFDGDVQTATVKAELVDVLSAVIDADISAAAEAKIEELTEAVIEKIAANEEIKAAAEKVKSQLEALKTKVSDKLPDEIEEKLSQYLDKIINAAENGADIDLEQVKAALYAKLSQLEDKLPEEIVSELRAVVDEMISVIEANLDTEAIEAKIDELVAVLESIDTEDVKTAVKYVLGGIYSKADLSGLKALAAEAYAKVEAQGYIDYAKSMVDSIAGIYGGSIDVSGVEAAIEALAADVKAKIESGSFDADDLDALETDVDAILSALIDLINQIPDMTLVFGSNPTKIGEYDCCIINVSKNYKSVVASAKLTIKEEENGLYFIDLSNNDVGVEPGDIVEVDGVPYPVDEDCLVWVEKTTHKIVTSYDYAVSNSTVDPDGITIHNEYPEHMYVWYLTFAEEKTLDKDGNEVTATYPNGNVKGNYVDERVPELDDFLTYKGTSIRMTGNRGIRFITAVNSADRKTLINGKLIESCSALEGYKLVEYGTLMGFESRGSLYIGNGAQSYAYRPGDDRVFSRQGSDIWFTGMLVGNELELPENARLELLMRPYFIIEGPDGEQIPIYGGQFQRSLGYVALQNRNYTAGGQAAYNFIWKIIRNAYGKDYKYAG